MFRAIVFDLDHTLFDRYATLRATLHAFYDHYRDKIPQDLPCDEFIEKLIEIEKYYIYYDWSAVFKQCAKQGMIDFDDEQAKEAVKIIVGKCWPIAAVEYPFTKPTLKKLRDMGYKIGLITNGSHNSQHLKLNKLGIEDMFDEIITTGDVGAHKPAAEPFEVFSQRIGISPEEMMYVGDHPLNDVEGSRRAGYTPVWVKTTGTWFFDDIEKAPYEVDTVAELPELLAKIDK